MRRLLCTSLLALFALPAAAQQYGGGGITLHQPVIDWDVPGQVGPNALNCIGGIGYGVGNGRRKGGEFHACGGPYANMAMGGAHFGFQSKRGGLWLTGYNTIGGGWIGVHGRGDDRSRFDGAFIYTRPSIGAGVAVGRFAAVEGSAYAMLPLNLVGVAGPGVDPQFSFPHVGLQASLMFGDFSRRAKVRDVEVPYPPPPPPPAAPEAPRAPAAPTPPPPPAPAGPMRPGDLPPASPKGPPPPAPTDSRPLAIPG